VDDDQDDDDDNDNNIQTPFRVGLIVLRATNVPVSNLGLPTDCANKIVRTVSLTTQTTGQHLTLGHDHTDCTLITHYARYHPNVRHDTF
jgi:hypothetical protein